MCRVITQKIAWFGVKFERSEIICYVVKRVTVRESKGKVLHLKTTRSIIWVQTYKPGPRTLLIKLNYRSYVIYNCYSFKSLINLSSLVA